MHLCEKQTVRWLIAFSDAAGRQKRSEQWAAAGLACAPSRWRPSYPGVASAAPATPALWRWGWWAQANLSSLPLPSPWAQLFSDRRTPASLFSESFWLHRVTDNICQQIHLLKKTYVINVCVCVCVCFHLFEYCLQCHGSVLKVYEMIQRLLDISQELPLGSKLNLRLFYD